ncbi:head GIN domain-containing protein [Flavobacterium subsaxonicum]|uniref:Putative auto-transporter adhesin head GIN domain-containing protein n=1 Tax=Flavobacterium subsaxonicum WB 4.1-42 = DSM 21790 TaxID=1121898 RepID=A0A0A2MPQ4_9FLAO|nr:head GIN domain-containing protein [Flavobacterium subsaxonicum]KGO93561.1 hypothetical protein Q766_06225 [Flavobacterium subsaxonicum WB 4.1-42 = DSM 21790]
MKKLLTLVVAFLCAATVTAQDEVEASGKITKSQRSVGNFENLDVTGSFNVILEEGATGNITVEASDNIAPYIITEVNGNTLSISTKKGMRFRASKGNKVTIHIPFKTLNEIKLTGSGCITSDKTIASNTKIHLNGSGNITLHVNSAKTDALVTGSGSIKLVGLSEHFSCRVTGSGSIKATELESDNVEADVTGSGSLKVLSNKIIKGRITGSGSIAFAGEPQERDLKKTGSGDFKTL